MANDNGASPAAGIYYVNYTNRRFERACWPSEACEYCGRVNKKTGASCQGCGAPTGVVGLLVMDEERIRRLGGHVATSY